MTVMKGSSRLKKLAERLRKKREKESKKYQVVRREDSEELEWDFGGKDAKKK